MTKLSLTRLRLRERRTCNSLLDPQNNLHAKARNLSVSSAKDQIFTSEMVLTEVLNYFSKRGVALRQATVGLIHSIHNSSAIEIVSQTSERFDIALELYGQRLDQAWSHTDCASFCIMQQRGIQMALAYDRHHSLSQ